MTASTIGILYPGEMGAAIGDRLRAHHRVVTTTEGRSAATVERSSAAELAVLSTVAEVAQASDAVISLVDPSAATAVAEACARTRTDGTLFIEANSIAVETAARVREIVENAGYRYVAAGVRGGAHRLETDGVVYLSGVHAGEVAELLEPALRVHRLGDDPAQAKALKLLVGGLAKGTNLLFLELAAAAARLDLLDSFEAEIADFYPHLSAWFARFVPTFVPHAGRRLSEMTDLAHLIEDAEMSSDMIRAAQAILTEIADMGASEQTALARTLTLLTERPIQT